MLKEMSEEVGPSEYHQMIKFKKGLLDPFKFLIIIQDCAGLDELIQSQNTRSGGHHDQRKGIVIRTYQRFSRS